jgi:hypothetical protein
MEATAMATNLRELLEQLKLERDILANGGYGRSVRTPWQATRLFRDSITCLNFGEEVKKHPCEECILWDWVPEDRRDADIPCHFIPLNEHGETIASLEFREDRDRAEEALLAWLNREIAKLEEKLKQEVH